MRVGIVAPSSKVPATEFALGLERIRGAGLDPVVHPHVSRGHLFFAGTDEERARSVWDQAQDDSLPVLWSARGGYGAARILPLLDAYARKRRRPLPRKLLVGYSDSTALLEYVRTRWGWATLHAPMPGLRQFCQLPDGEWQALLGAIRKGLEQRPIADAPWQSRPLEFLRGSRPRAAVRGPVVGGNLSVWCSLIGTPYAIGARGKIVFLEDVDENLYRVDRMVQQLIGSGALKGARAVVLGNFLGCRDLVPRVLARPPAAADRERAIREPDPAWLEPLRPTMGEGETLDAIFGEVVGKLRIPVARGLGVGHGPGKAPLPLGGQYELTPRGALKQLKA